MVRSLGWLDACAVALVGIATIAVLTGCAPKVEYVENTKYVDNTPKSRLLRRTASVDIGEIGFGESLWLKRSVQNDEHYSDGRVVSAKNTDLMFCRDVPGTGPTCRPVAFTDQETRQAELGVDSGSSVAYSVESQGGRVTLPSVPSVVGGQDIDPRNKDIATQCRDSCAQFVVQSRNAIPDSTQRSKLAMKCVEQCRLSGAFLMCMTQSKADQLWDKCSSKMN